MQDEFENLIARLRGFFSVSFNEDGTLLAQPTPPATPIGSLVAYAAATAPAGWLLCDGTAVSRDTYKPLFEVIGTTYGAGDGSTTFNVPDLRGRFPLGKAVAGTGSTLAGTGGAIDHVHSGPSHTHTISGSTASTTASIGSDGGHSHTVNSHTHDLGSHTHNITIPGTVVQSGSGANVFNNQTTSTDGPSTNTSGTASPGTDTQGSHSHGGATGSHSHGAGTLAADAAGTGNTGTANPPFLSLIYIIRT